MPPTDKKKNPLQRVKNFIKEKIKPVFSKKEKIPHSKKEENASKIQGPTTRGNLTKIVTPAATTKSLGSTSMKTSKRQADVPPASIGKEEDPGMKLFGEMLHQATLNLPPKTRAKAPGQLRKAPTSGGIRGDTVYIPSNNSTKSANTVVATKSSGATHKPRKAPTSGGIREDTLIAPTTAVKPPLPPKPPGLKKRDSSPGR